jgi:sigma-B regulation protein RsbU (phosphoserine phosphatase)
MTKLAELLNEIPFLAVLPQEELDRLAAAAQLRRYLPGELLFREGDPGDCMVVVLSGEIEIIKALDTPAQQLLNVAGPGSFLGELSLLDQAQRRSASARVRAAAELLQIPFAVFDQLLERRPALAFHLLRLIAERLRTSEAASIRELTEKNRQLSQALEELKASQAQLIEKEVLESELRMARRIQESLLPQTTPELPGWQLTARWFPARAVSGDFYDFFPLPDGRLALVIGDVTDKGVPASLVMAATRSLLRASAAQQSSPSRILGLVNNLLCLDIPSSMFVTCLFAALDVGSGSLRIANAGHCRPLLFNTQQTTEPRLSGFPLGILPDSQYEETELTIPPGGQLFCYSDGLPEAHNPASEMYSFARLRAWMQAYWQGGEASASGVLQGLQASLQEFVGADWKQEDDITLLLLERQS